MKWLLAVLVLCWLGFVPDFKLRNDLKKDRLILSQHGSLITMADKAKLKFFDQYAKMDLSRFDFSRRKQGRHTISHWQQSGGKKLNIYMVVTPVKLDTVYEEDQKKMPLKVGFSFRTYIIKSATRQLIYLTEEHQGLCNFIVDGKSFSIAYEDIPIGFTCPDIKEIMNLTAEN
ncbi:hypothetical protein A0256_03945 [Mucilaginibacter sp. PAMC 26640]|nr:hypothetical protein A0256_03945 [Mucilaginibacter sp. PAMC 26640]